MKIQGNKFIARSLNLLLLFFVSLVVWRIHQLETSDSAFDKIITDVHLTKKEKKVQINNKENNKHTKLDTISLLSHELIKLSFPKYYSYSNEQPNINYELQNEFGSIANVYNNIEKLKECWKKYNTRNSGQFYDFDIINKLFIIIDDIIGHRFSLAYLFWICFKNNIRVILRVGTV